MSSTGIMLPDCDDGTDEMMRDIEYMKEMYPEELRNGQYGRGGGV